MWIFLFCGVVLILVFVGRFLLAAEDSSPSLKMSGVLKKVNLTDPQNSQLIVAGESGLEKTLLLTAETPISYEKTPLKVEALKEGDVLDIEVEVNEATGQVVAKSVSVIVRPTLDPVSQNPVGSEDPEFEGMGKNDKKNSM